MIVAVLEAAQNRLDPPRADLGARHVRGRTIVQRGIGPLQPCLREIVVAEHLLGVVRDSREGERPGGFMLCDHESFYHAENGAVMIASFTASQRQVADRTGTRACLRWTHCSSPGAPG